MGVCLDNVNLIRVGDDMAEGTRALAPHTLLVQLKDHVAGEPDVPGGPVSTALGEGVADLDGLIGILATAGFDGPVCVELASLGPGDVDELAMIERSLALAAGARPGLTFACRPTRPGLGQTGLDSEGRRRGGDPTAPLAVT